MRVRLGLALYAGFLAWFGIYVVEFLWTLSDHPSSWIRVYLGGPLLSLIALYAIAALLTALALLPWMKEAADGKRATAGRAAFGIAAGALAIWLVVRNAYPDALGLKHLAGSILALVAAVALTRFLRGLLRGTLVGVATAIVAIAVIGTLAAHGFLNAEMASRRAPVAAPLDRPDILLLTVDTLRSRNIGAYGYERAWTPHIDRLAAEGTRWTDVNTPVPQTGPSFATLLSGLHPTRHGLIENGWRLDEQIETLPEHLAAAGWQTYGFVSVAHLGSAYGFSQGFDLFVNQNPIFDDFYLYSSSTGARFSLVDLLRGIDLPQLEGTPWNPSSRSRRGDLTIDDVIQHLPDRSDSKPFFLWVHLFDPHLPHTAPERLYDHFQKTELTLPESSISKEEVRKLFDGYDAEVAFVDEQVGRLLKAFGSRLDRMLVIFTSDHGEALGEHGYRAHANHVSQEIIQVPFILRWRGHIRPGAVEAGRGYTMDVAPTILALLDLPPLEGVDGQNLLTSARDDSLYLMTDNPTGRQIRGIMQGELKMILTAPHGFEEGGWSEATRELYHLGRDPGEEDNLAAVEPGQAGRMENDMRAYFAMGEVDPQVVDDATRRSLKALGYVE